MKDRNVRNVTTTEITYPSETTFVTAYNLPTQNSFVYSRDDNGLLEWRIYNPNRKRSAIHRPIGDDEILDFLERVWEDKYFKQYFLKSVYINFGFIMRDGEFRPSLTFIDPYPVDPWMGKLYFVNRTICLDE